MKRRDFLKTSIATTLNFILPYSNAKAIPFISSEHLKELTFSSVYPRPIYEKSYFTLVVIGASIVTAGVISYFTAGAGAPAAAPFVSTIASWIGGGGAGSYMAGLSTIGNIFGGNAMLGAAILNGISIGTFGTAGGKAALSLAARAANIVDISLSGIAYLRAKEDEKGVYIFDIKIPQDLGSGTVRRLVDTIYDLEDERKDALENKFFKKAERISKQIEEECKKGVKLLENEFSKKKPSQENLLVLGILAYKIGNINDFSLALSYIDEFYQPRRTSFLDYLKGINELSVSKSYNKEKALEYFDYSYKQEPYTIEPVMPLISLLGEEYWNNKEKINKWITLAAKNFDSDKYEGRPLISLYSKAATIAFNNEDWETALFYYSEEYKELGIITRILPIAKEIKSYIKMQMAICHKHLGNYSKAQNLKKEVLENCETESCRKQYEKLFDES